MLASDIAMILTDGVCRRERIVRQLIVFSDLAYQGSSRLPARQLLSQEAMEDRAGSVECLQFILDIKRFKHIFSIAYWQVGAVGIIRSIAVLAASSDDIRIALQIMFGKAVGSGFCRSSLKVIELSRIQLLIIS